MFALVNCEDQNFSFWQPGFDLPRRLDPIHDGHRMIDDRETSGAASMAFSTPAPPSPASATTSKLGTMFDDLLQARAYDLVVVSDQDANRTI